MLEFGFYFPLPETPHCSNCKSERAFSAGWSVSYWSFCLKRKSDLCLSGTNVWPESCYCEFSKGFISSVNLPERFGWVTSEIKAKPGKIRLHAWSTRLHFWWSSRYLKSRVLRARKLGVGWGGGDHPKIKWYHTIDSWLFEIPWQICFPSSPHYFLSWE